MPRKRLPGQCHDCSHPAVPGESRCQRHKEMTAAAVIFRLDAIDERRAAEPRQPVVLSRVFCPRCTLRGKHVCLPGTAVEYAGTHRGHDLGRISQQRNPQ